jgi:hypothetical protein
MRLALIASLVGVFGLLRAEVARADCASPRAAVAPHEGAVVPPDPVVYVFVPSWAAEKAAITARSGGEALAYSSKVVSESEAFTTLRIAVETDGHDEFELTHDGSYGATTTSRFRVSEDWARPKRRAVRVRAGEYVVDEWTCSHTDAHFLTVTDAPAYRVEWATSRDAFANGKAKAIVMPHHVDDFWLWGDQRAKTGAGRIGLGHLNCFGESAASGRGYRSRFVRVKGLYPDGSASKWSPIVEVGEGGLAPAEEPVAPSVAPPVELTIEPPPAVETVVARPVVAHRPIAARPARDEFDPSPLVALLAGVLGFLLGRGAVRRLSDERSARLGRLADASIPQVLAVFTGIGACVLAVHAGVRVAAAPCESLGFAIAAATWALVAGVAVALTHTR